MAHTLLVIRIVLLHALYGVLNPFFPNCMCIKNTFFYFLHSCSTTVYTYIVSCRSRGCPTKQTVKKLMVTQADETDCLIVYSWDACFRFFERKRFHTKKLDLSMVKKINERPHSPSLVILNNERRFRDFHSFRVHILSLCIRFYVK